MADEHTSRVQSDLQAKQRRPASASTRPTRPTPPGPRRTDARAFNSELDQAARIAEATARELRDLGRPRPKAPSSGKEGGSERRVASSSSAAKAQRADGRWTASTPDRSRTQGTAGHRARPASPPPRESPMAAKVRTAAKMSYTELMKHAPESHAKPVRRPLPTVDERHKVVDPTPRTPVAATTTSKATNGAPASAAKPNGMTAPPNRPGALYMPKRVPAAAAVANRARATPSGRPVASSGRSAKPLPSTRTVPADLIPLHKSKRDRRSIEEVQSDLKRRRVDDVPTRAPPRARSVSPPPVRERPPPSTTPPSRSHARFAGKKPPTSSVAEPTHVAQKRPPTVPRGRSPVSRVSRPPTGPAREPPRPVAGKKLPRSTTTTTPTRPTVSQKKPPTRPAGAQYGGKRPPVGRDADGRAPVARKRPPSGPAAPLRPSYPGQRRLDRHRYPNEEDEEDSEMDDFIVSDEDEMEEDDIALRRRRRDNRSRRGSGEDVSSVLKDVFGYDRRRYANRGYEEDSADDMEADARAVRQEEARSARLARQEDAAEEERERQELERKRRRQREKERQVR
ncbi:hypothetical protein IWQ60_011991 [Tieghemiomyces parasiticus]|uniref:SPT2 chromatin protein n=1 Tax=Tieghemiomyces parasiticus TaxID=78921 RepID=A0A9W7ZPH2_9FUNG|nr:hypothetical protein IWQ60_011991 [Tieghemiomyces parasiticus]